MNKQTASVVKTIFACATISFTVAYAVDAVAQHDRNLVSPADTGAHSSTFNYDQAQPLQQYSNTDSAGYFWVVCDGKKAGLLYSDTWQLPVIKKSYQVSGPFRGSLVVAHDYNALKPPKECASDWYDTP